MAPSSQLRSFRTYGWCAFLLLLLVESFRWMVVQGYPRSSSTLTSQFAGCSCAALALLALSCRRISRYRPDRRSSIEGFRLLTAGAMLSCGPCVPFILKAQAYDPVGITAAMMLTSAVIVVVLSASGDAASSTIGSRIWPGLVGLAGFLLLVTQPQLGVWRADTAYILMPLLTGVGAVLLCKSKRTTATRMTLAFCGASLASGVALAIAGAFGHTPAQLSSSAALLDGACEVLGIFSLVVLGAVRWSARYIWVPLLVVLQSLLLLRQSLAAQQALGCAFLLVSSVVLSFVPADEKSVEASDVGL